MRTTEVRQLLPDAWGFICPVHTPDGSPCGLLNHLTMNCRVTDVPDAKKVANIPYVLARFGMWSLGDVINKAKSVSYVILLDGKVVGYVWQKFAERMVRQLRWLKIEGKEVPDTLEIVFIPMESYTTQIPGIYLFTGPARMMRPVWNLSTKSVEYVGTFEQVYLDICVAPEEFYKGEEKIKRNCGSRRRLRHLAYLTFCSVRICRRDHPPGALQTDVPVQLGSADPDAGLQPIPA
jgi:DNA-directed RNA polymerase I subunit RPA2